MKKLFIYLVVFTCGFIVMLTEIAGARLINPYFGVGIYVWAALISVTLTGLALGYWVGGILADKKPSWGVFYLIVLLPTLPLLIIPFIFKELALFCSTNFGIAGGVLICSTIIFLFPLFILGITTPFALRMASKKLEMIGKTSGKLYGISTLGSLAGTLLTAFLLIPNITVSKSFIIAAMICSLLATAGFVLSGFRKLALVGILIFAASLIIFVSYKVNLPQHVLFEDESLYGNIKVVEYEIGETDNVKYSQKCLLINGYIHSIADTNTKTPDNIEINCEYIITLALLEEFYPNAEKGLLIGYGAGLLPILYEQNNFSLQFDVVEIDQKIMDVSFEHFGKPSNLGKIYINDGRNYVQSCKKKYDIVVVDVISADSIPLNIFSIEFFNEMKSIIAEEGFCAINAMGNYKKADELAAIFNTLKLSFPNVRAFYANTDVNGNYTNVVFFGSENEIDFHDPDFEKDWVKWEATFPETKKILTDNNNTLDIDSSEMGLNLREKTLKYLPDGFK